MATKSNRAATAATKLGGRRRRRNQASKRLNPSKRLDRPENQQAFKAGRHETMARIHNATSSLEEEAGVPGAVEGRGYTPRRRSKGTAGAGQMRASPVFKLHSSVFGPHAEIPERYTAQGQNISPELYWSDPPGGTEELILLCEDIDSPAGEPFVHWLVYRIPSTVNGLPEAVPPVEQIGSIGGAPLQGKNSMGRLGYYGPVPPLFDPWHHYRFRLFALETPIHDVWPGMTREEILQKMRPHLLEVAEFTARYQRPIPQKKRA